MSEILVQGLLLGGLYALFALGQSLMFGVMRLTNTAQGDFVILGAYAAISMLGAVAPMAIARIASGSSSAEISQGLRATAPSEAIAA